MNLFCSSFSLLVLFGLCLEYLDFKIDYVSNGFNLSVNGSLKNKQEVPFFGQQPEVPWKSVEYLQTISDFQYTVNKFKFN